MMNVGAALSALSSIPSARRVAFYFGLAALLLLAAGLSGLAIGSTHVAPGEVVKVIAAHLLPAGWIDLSSISEPARIIVWSVRAPRVIVAALIGAALAVAGAQMQGLFQNPLASPDLVGTSAGGALGAVLALVTGLAARSLFYLPVISFVFSLAALLIVHALASRRGRTSMATLLLAGVALGALLSAATSFLISLTWVRYEVAQEVMFWLMGGLDSRTWQHVWLLLPCVIISLSLAFSHTRELDLLLTGEETAASLGVEIERTKRITLVSAALLTGASVAVSGVIGFVGLVVPHVVRLLAGPKHRTLIPLSALLGAVFMILSDLCARTLHQPEEIRLGIITAFFGAPFFLFLLLRQRRETNYL